MFETETKAKSNWPKSKLRPKVVFDWNLLHFSRSLILNLELLSRIMLLTSKEDGRACSYVVITTMCLIILYLD